MILVCSKCLKAALLVGLSDDGIRLLSGLRDEDMTFPCVCCDGRMFYHRVVSRAVMERPDRYELEDFEVQEYYRACHGFGSQEEAELAAPAVVQRLMDGATISGVELEQHGKRAVLKSLVVSGYRIHFASGTYGATAYKVTRHDRDELVDGCRAEGGAQVGPAPGPPDAPRGGDDGGGDPLPGVQEDGPVRS